jgi:hypothetical protein
MGNCKSVCLNGIVSSKMVDLDTIHGDEAAPLRIEPTPGGETINIIDKYSKDVISSSTTLLNVTFYSNFLQGKNIEECIRVVIQELSSKDLFLLVDFIYENIYSSKDINNNEVLSMFKLSLRKIMLDLNQIILPLTESMANVKIYFLSVINNFVEIYHYLRLRNGSNGNTS